jgi:hypothetical protein
MAASTTTLGTTLIDREEQRDELRRVLQSPSFQRAPKLAQLLEYLGEKLFSGEAAQIKEYSIGVEVFHRGPGFDQDSDSIVRVEANRLRKRLAEYYAGEGAQNHLHITIPLGQYVPDFVSAGQRPLAARQPVAGSKIVGNLQRLRLFLSLHKKNTGVLALLVGVALLAFGYWEISRTKTPPSPSADHLSVSQQAAEPGIGPPAGEEIRILAGDSRSFVDHAGKLWSADVFFTGGEPVKSATQHIARTLDPEFYRSSRQGQFRYDIPLRRGIYELRLHFAETVYGPESNGVGGEGSRILTVRANGKTLLDHLDLVADAGAAGTADVKVFTGIEPAADGQLHLEFSGAEGRLAILSAIEILPGLAGKIRPVRILARTSPYYSNDSQWWSPDDAFQGGQLATYSTPVSGTDDPELYETERWGNFSYAVPVTPARYTAVLHFALRHNAWSPSSQPPVGAQVFNVYCNGKALLQDFNLAKEGHDVVVRRFTGLEPNAQGKLLFSFVPVEGYASVAGIEVLPQ